VAPSGVDTGAAAYLDTSRVLVAGASAAARSAAAILDVSAGAWIPTTALPEPIVDPVAVGVAPGAALVMSQFDSSAFVFADGTWTAVAQPASYHRVDSVAPVSQGAIVIDGYATFETRTFRASDATWVAGPSPIGVRLAGLVPFGDRVLLVGGCDVDFVAWANGD